MIFLININQWSIKKQVFWSKIHFQVACSNFEMNLGISTVGDLKGNNIKWQNKLLISIFPLNFEQKCDNIFKISSFITRGIFDAFLLFPDAIGTFCTYLMK